MGQGQDAVFDPAVIERILPLVWARDDAELHDEFEPVPPTTEELAVLAALNLSHWQGAIERSITAYKRRLLTPEEMASP